MKFNNYSKIYKLPPLPRFMLELVLALALGILIGIFSGLFPGIHINLVSAFLLFISASLTKFVSPLFLVIFIVAMSITHVFLDFIPSIFLGAPEEPLSTMPGHKFLLKGKGYEAVFLTLLGALFSAIITTLLIPLFIFLVPIIYPFLERMMAWTLVVISLLMIFQDENKIWAAIIFVLAGFLGLSSLNLQVNQSLLPLLSGLFGSSSLIFSISQKTKIPKQSEKLSITKRELVKPILVSNLLSPICGFLPGLGSSQAAVISSSISNPTRKQFLVILGSVNSIVMILSFLALYSLDKARTGSAAAIQDLIKISLPDLALILIAALISSIISFFIAIKIAKLFARNISRFNYSKISIAVLVILTLLVFFISGPLGFLIYITATLIGILAIETKIRKSILMACLLVPTIVFYLPI